MNSTSIFAPFFAMIALTFVVWVYMYARRIPFIIRSKLTPEQLSPVELARLSPPAVANPSDNLKNLFVPLRFWLYAGGALSLWFMAVRAALELLW
jgi:hypothetical protein